MKLKPSVNGSRNRRNEYGFHKYKRERLVEHFHEQVIAKGKIGGRRRRWLWLESERALQQVIFAIMADNMELFKQFQDNPSFKKWLPALRGQLADLTKGRGNSFSPSIR